jgi:hypothetical protein
MRTTRFVDAEAVAAANNPRTNTPHKTPLLNRMRIPL